MHVILISVRTCVCPNSDGGKKLTDLGQIGARD
jgi:hypothetical protein